MESSQGVVPIMTEAPFGPPLERRVVALSAVGQPAVLDAVAADARPGLRECGLAFVAVEAGEGRVPIPQRHVTGGYRVYETPADGLMTFATRWKLGMLGRMARSARRVGPGPLFGVTEATADDRMHPAIHFKVRVQVGGSAPRGRVVADPTVALIRVFVHHPVLGRFARRAQLVRRDIRML